MPDKEHPGSRHTLFHHLCQKKLSEILPLPWNVGVRLRPMQMFTMWRTLCTLNAKTLLRLVCFMFYDKTCTPLTIRVRLFIFWFAECRNFVHSSGLWGMLFIFFLFSDGYFLFSDSLVNLSFSFGRFVSLTTNFLEKWPQSQRKVVL